MSRCQKIAFESRGAAKAWARDGRRKGRPIRANNAYVCRFCGMWHLTSQKRPEERRIARSKGERAA